jgi:hypothetical protein
VTWVLGWTSGDWVYEIGSPSILSSCSGPATYHHVKPVNCGQWLFLQLLSRGTGCFRPRQGSGGSMTQDCEISFPQPFSGKNGLGERTMRVTETEESSQARQGRSRTQRVCALVLSTLHVFPLRLACQATWRRKFHRSFSYNTCQLCS